ncbi:MAG: dephospho-CoA kinase [Gammaproteobacteria bacterium]|nr:dephospho-CoA kinase [Gammaproteobacteria bacterium]MCK5262436.1 dephospho-CoA kinase [Gammaproteobacteria bacterium]
MWKIGLTGGIGSGKSTVADIFSSLGITIIDADLIAHQLTQPGNASFNEIKKLFGENFIDSNGELNRKKIAETIFSNPSKKTDLENILHPRIKQCMLQEIEQAKYNHYIVLVIPLLLESNFIDLVDRIIVVDADDDIRIQRIQQRDHRSEEQINDIINSQLDRNKRLQRADDILYNNGELGVLRDAVSRLHRQYLEMSS